MVKYLDVCLPVYFISVDEVCASIYIIYVSKYPKEDINFILHSTSARLINSRFDYTDQCSSIFFIFSDSLFVSSWHFNFYAALLMYIVILVFILMILYQKIKLI